MGVEAYAALLERMYGGRKWIVAGDTASDASVVAERLLDAGAEAVMVIAGTAGMGPQPPSHIRSFVAGTTGTTRMAAIRALAAALATPSPELCAAVDTFDPLNEALVRSSYHIPSGELCGRQVSAQAHPEWRGLEDKLIVDALWDGAAVERAKALIVDPVQPESIRRAVGVVAGTDGAVLVADNTEGWHGGAEYTRYLAPGADDAATTRFFAEHSRQVRVMPYLRGIPCSIHGIVTADSVLAFRPVEVLVFRRPNSDEFVYTGVDTVWDPPVSVRERMRAAVRAVGARIREAAGYRGAFGIDGVCTRRGFLPTELNPRLTTGLRIQADAAGQYPIDDINRAVTASVDVDLSRLEGDIVEGADANRAGIWTMPIPTLTVDETTEQPIRYVGTAWRPAGSESADAVMSLGPAQYGALLRVELSAHRLGAGRSLATIAAASFALADQTWHTGIGELITGDAPSG